MPLDGDAGIVHEDVELAEFGGCCIHQRLGGGEIRLVALDRDGSNPLRPEVPDDGLRLVGRSGVADRDVCAVLSERFRLLAEQHVADVELVGRKPRNLTHLEAAILTLVGGTVWEAFVQRAQLKVGETILIHGGEGGVGTIAIQIARAIGARVITTVLARDHAFVRSLGANEAIDFTAEDYVEAVARLTGGEGVNVIFDTIGGDTLTKSPLALAAFGRVVSLVDLAQSQNLIAGWGKNAAYHFVFTRQNRGKLDSLTRLVERGLVKPVIGATLPLAHTAEAHGLLGNGGARGLRGKVVIDVSGEAVALPPAQQRTF